MPDSWSSCCHSLGRPVNSPVDELKPTWVRCTGSYGVLISGFLAVWRNSGIMEPRKPFLFFMVPVPGREREPSVEEEPDGSRPARS